MRGDSTYLSNLQQRRERGETANLLTIFAEAHNAPYGSQAQCFFQERRSAGRHSCRWHKRMMAGGGVYYGRLSPTLVYMVWWPTAPSTCTFASQATWLCQYIFVCACLSSSVDLAGRPLLLSPKPNVYVAHNMFDLDWIGVVWVFRAKSDYPADGMAKGISPSNFATAGVQCTERCWYKYWCVEVGAIVTGPVMRRAKW